jgi:hypothetical protein
LLAKNYKPTWTKTTKFQVASLPEILWFWSCVGKMYIRVIHGKKDQELVFKIRFPMWF